MVYFNWINLISLYYIYFFFVEKLFRVSHHIKELATAVRKSWVFINVDKIDINNNSLFPFLAFNNNLLLSLGTVKFDLDKNNFIKKLLNKTNV